MVQRTESSVGKFQYLASRQATTTFRYVAIHIVIQPPSYSRGSSNNQIFRRQSAQPQADRQFVTTICSLQLQFTQIMQLFLLIRERDTQCYCLSLILFQPLTRIFSVGFKETFFPYDLIQKVITTTSGGVSMYCTAGYCQRRHFQSSSLHYLSETHFRHVFQRHYSSKILIISKQRQNIYYAFYLV